MSGIAALQARSRVPVPVAHTFHALGVVKRRHQGARDPPPPGTADGGPPPRRARHRLLYLGRLVERKGVDTVIESLTGLPDTELLIAGGPDPATLDADPECRRLQAAARRHGVAERVRLLGRVCRQEAPRLIRSADVLVSMPWYEPFGIVPLEAMACGVPVVTSGVGGMLDTVVDGVTGLHVPPADPSALTGALTLLLAAPARRRAMGRAGAARAAAHFGWDRVAELTEDVYRQLTTGRAVVPASGITMGGRAAV